jgi:phospholipase C
MHSCSNKALAVAASAVITLVPASPAFAQQGDSATTTPIKHVIVIFPENVAFDHYFGTYPFCRLQQRWQRLFRSTLQFHAACEWLESGPAQEQPQSRQSLSH